MRIINKIFYYILDLQKYSMKKKIKKIEEKIEAFKKIIFDAEILVKNSKDEICNLDSDKREIESYMNILSKLE